jgi:hypothetical protein
VVGIGAIYRRHRHLAPEIRPSAFTTAGLWVATGLILVVMAYYVVLTYA